MNVNPRFLITDEQREIAHRQDTATTVRETLAGFHRTMPFGRYRNKPLISINTPYLRWVLSNCDDIEIVLRDRIERLLDYRNGGEI